MGGRSGKLDKLLGDMCHLFREGNGANGSTLYMLKKIAYYF